MHKSFVKIRACNAISDCLNKPYQLSFSTQNLSTVCSILQSYAAESYAADPGL